jgi:DtxR family Mn-dependent transcriptional regulator
MSDLVEERLLALLDDPLVSPYGNAIPGLGELGIAPGGVRREGEISVATALKDGVSRVTVLRFGEAAQAEPGLLDAVIAAGILPGASLAIAAEGAEYVLTGDSGAVVVSGLAARHIFAVSS